MNNLIFVSQALDRDPPRGKATWKLKVRVTDGQRNLSQYRRPKYFGNNKGNGEEKYTVDQTHLEREEIHHFTNIKHGVASHTIAKRNSKSQDQQIFNTRWPKMYNYSSIMTKTENKMYLHRKVNSLEGFRNITKFKRSLPRKLNDKKRNIMSTISNAKSNSNVKISDTHSPQKATRESNMENSDISVNFIRHRKSLNDRFIFNGNGNASLATNNNLTATISLRNNIEAQKVDLLKSVVDSTEFRNNHLSESARRLALATLSHTQKLGPEEKIYADESINKHTPLSNFTELLMIHRNHKATLNARCKYGGQCIYQHKRVDLLTNNGKNKIKSTNSAMKHSDIEYVPNSSSHTIIRKIGKEHNNISESRILTVPNSPLSNVPNEPLNQQTKTLNYNLLFQNQRNQKHETESEKIQLLKNQRFSSNEYENIASNYAKPIITARDVSKLAISTLNIQNKRNIKIKSAQRLPNRSNQNGMQLNDIFERDIMLRGNSHSPRHYRSIHKSQNHFHDPFQQMSSNKIKTLFNSIELVKEPILNINSNSINETKVGLHKNISSKCENSKSRNCTVDMHGYDSFLHLEKKKRKTIEFKHKNILHDSSKIHRIEKTTNFPVLSNIHSTFPVVQALPSTSNMPLDVLDTSNVSNNVSKLRAAKVYKGSYWVHTTDGNLGLTDDFPFKVGPKRSILINQLGIKLDSGGCLDPATGTLYPQDGNTDSTFNLFDEYQRILLLVELEKGVRRSIHVVETELTIVVKDINDNAPTFPNVTMYGEVQENGPIGE